MYSHNEFVLVNNNKMMIWKKKSKTLIIDKYVWYIKRDINVRKRAQQN